MCGYELVYLRGYALGGNRGGGYLDRMPRRNSQLASHLSATLGALGEDVSPRQIERLGEAGLLGQPPYPSELTERAREAMELVRQCWGRHDLAVLVMFVHGRHPVGETRLKRAYNTSLGRLERSYRRPARRR